MIYGIGTDLVEIGRIAAAVERFGERFVDRILGPLEKARYESRRARSASRGLAFLATRFAAKEAVSKAIGLGLRSPMTWRAVEIINAPSGQPQVLAHGALAEFLRARRLRLSVSVTDEQAMAMAFVIAEVTDGTGA
ncbi:MAG: holo-ACP synthase [Burkholderiales bacterium]|nr:MAG: holo-ACP synthase [Burkholderiales bacterium]